MSGKGRGDRQLSTHELLSEFDNHKENLRIHSTALISATVSIIDVLRRAFNKLYGGEKPDQIWIVFISVPHENKHTYYHAEHLAQETGHENPRVFTNEFIFVGEIPEEYIIHKVSVQTLLDRGFDMKRSCGYSNDIEQLPRSSLLRQQIAKHILDPSNSGYHIGLSLEYMARHFGARAVVYDIAHQILFECTWVVDIDYDAQYVHLFCNNTQETILVDFEHFCCIDNGINEAIVDFWLTDLNFCPAYAEHCEWVSRLQDEMEREWETFGEYMNDNNDSYTEQHYRMLQAREDEMHNRD